MLETITPLVEFLRNMESTMEEHGHGHLSVHGYVLRHGRTFKSQPLTVEEREYIDLCGWPEHQMRQCWQNAQTAALTMPPGDGMTLLYVEGFVGTGLGIGINHAWLSLNGKVVDTTIRIDHRKRGTAKNRPLGEFPEGWEYYGVELDPSECMHSQEHRDGMGPLIDDWLCGWPLLARDQAGRRLEGNPGTGPINEGAKRAA